MENVQTKISILIGMMDWGLGHTTRCIPIIHELIDLDFDVHIAGTKMQTELLKKEISKATFVNIPGYNVHLSKKRWMMSWSIISQVPGFLSVIKAEKNWIKKFVREKDIKVILSDNRPGFRNKNIHNIYITHQLSIKTGNFLTGTIATILHRRVIRKFNACWIPDSSPNGLGGQLSHQHIPGIISQFIGPLSRLEPMSLEKKYDIAFVLSGPEPQRTIFENKILAQINDSGHNFILVRGLPENTAELPIKNNLHIKNHLSATELNQVICSSRLVISRSGYTSVMDYVKTGIRAVLVPTPGQGEQEYLARFLSEKKIFMSVSQHNFSLYKLVEEALNFPFRIKSMDFNAFKPFLSDMKNRVNAGKTK